jgi:acyl dehydratase
MATFEIGQHAQTTRRFSAKDLAEYESLTGDATLGFGQPRGSAPSGERTVPGALIGGMFSYLLGTVLPGRGTNWLKQRLYFHQPARLGESLTATVEIIRLRPNKHLVNLATRCTNGQGELVCSGEALVLVKDVE